MVTETRNKSAEFFQKQNHVKVPKSSLTKSQVVYDAVGIPTLSMTGLTSGSAVIGDEASISVSVDQGTITARRWGSASGGSQFGTGTNPTDLTSGDEGTLYAGVQVGGVWYEKTAPIRHPFMIAGALSDVEYSEGIGNVDRDISSGFNTGVLTPTYALVGAPAGYSIPSGSTRRVATGTAADATITIRATDKYGATVDVDEVVDMVTATITFDDPGYTILVGDDDPLATTYSVTITGGTYDGQTANFDGQDIADLASGPVNLIAPTISGTGEVGETLTADDAGLWIHDPAATGISTDYQWQRDAVDISGATSATYQLVSADAETDVRVKVTQTDSNGNRAAVSTAISVAAASFTPTDLGAKLVMWQDFSDNSVMWQEVAKTTQVSATGQDIGYVADKSAQTNDVDGNVSSPYTDMPTRSAAGALFPVESLLRAAVAMTGFTSTMQVHAVVKPGKDTNIMLATSSGTQDAFLGLCVFESTSAPEKLAGTPVYMRNGADLDPAPANRGDLCDDWDAPEWQAWGARAVDLSASAWTIDNGIGLLGGYNQTSFDFAGGEARHFIITTDDLTTQEQDDLAAWLAAEVTAAGAA